MKLIIAGSREFTDYNYLKKVCYEVIPMAQYYLEVPAWEIEIISGSARGADSLGENFANEERLKLTTFPVTKEMWNDMTPPCYPMPRSDGTMYNAMAGYKRNEKMLDYCKDDYAITIAFIKGDSKGTKQMVKISKKALLPTWVVYTEKNQIRAHNIDILKNWLKLPLDKKFLL